MCDSVWRDFLHKVIFVETENHKMKSEIQVKDKSTSRRSLQLLVRLIHIQARATDLTNWSDLRT